MEAIADKIKNRLDEIRKAMIERVGKRGGINSDRADIIVSVMELMKEYTWPNLTRHATEKELEALATIDHDNTDIRRLWANEVYNRRFRYWLGRTKHLAPNDIRDMVKQARTGKNDQALFEYLLKQTKRGH